MDCQMPICDGRKMILFTYYLLGYEATTKINSLVAKENYIKAKIIAHSGY